MAADTRLGLRQQQQHKAAGSLRFPHGSRDEAGGRLFFYVRFKKVFIIIKKTFLA
jgi:hypothetical protein